MPKTEKQIIYKWKKKYPSVLLPKHVGTKPGEGKKVLHDEILLKKHKI